MSSKDRPFLIGHRLAETPVGIPVEMDLTNSREDTVEAASNCRMG
jgi:hypothetical protein